MKKAVCWGVGSVGRHVRELCSGDYEVLCYVDNDTSKYVRGGGAGLPIRSPEVLKSLDFDAVVLGTSMGFDDVSHQLAEMGIPEHKIDKSYVLLLIRSRILFLKRFAERVRKEGISGSVAEAGVYRGDFAQHINRYFPDRTCYLFDTFSGFTDYDIAREQKESHTSADYMKNTSVEEVLSKMPCRDKVIIKAGRFPETAQGIDDKFAFVNLDMDLYQPTIEGLRFFYPRMSEGGVILIHDYFSDAYPNIEQSVDDFEREIGRRLHRIPIGDDISLAIVK